MTLVVPTPWTFPWKRIRRILAKLTLFLVIAMWTAMVMAFPTLYLFSDFLVWYTQVPQYEQVDQTATGQK